MRTLPFALVLLISATAFAQPSSINWRKVSGGGGTSTGSVYSVSGTIGQHDAGGPSAGGTFSVRSGFWTLSTVQTPGGPLLKIFITTSNTVVVSWPSPSTGWNLQQNGNLNTTNWTTPSESVNDNGTVRFIIVNSPSGDRFYRLRSP